MSSVENALCLLEALRTQSSFSVKEAAEMLEVAPSTAHRLLTTLQAHGFVSQVRPSRRYEVGPALVDIALEALRGIDVRQTAHPYLQELASIVRETVNLIVLDGDQIRFIDSVEGPEAVRVSSRTGAVLPAHCTAGGKVLLAALDGTQLARLYPGRRLSALTPQSVTDRAALMTELAEIRRKGYATSFEQSTNGLSAVAVSVRGGSSQVIAAIGVSAPAARLDEERVASIVEATEKTAKAIEGALRHPAGAT